VKADSSLEDELVQCQRLKEAAEREARALYSTAKVRMAAVERSAIQTRKDLNTLEDLDNIARMKLDFEVKTRELLEETFPVETMGMPELPVEHFKPKIVWGPDGPFTKIDHVELRGGIEGRQMVLPDGTLLKEAMKQNKTKIRHASKPPLRDLPTNKDDIAEWRHLVTHTDGIVGDLIAQQAAMQEEDEYEDEEEEEMQSPGRGAWQHTAAMARSGSFNRGEDDDRERAGIRLETNVDPKKMSKYAKQDFIDEVAMQLGVAPSQIKLRT